MGHKNKFVLGVYGEGVRAKRKLLLKMSAACKGGRNVHELFFPPCLGQGGKTSFEQNLLLLKVAFLMRLCTHAVDQGELHLHPSGWIML